MKIRTELQQQLANCQPAGRQKLMLLLAEVVKRQAAANDQKESTLASMKKSQLMGTLNILQQTVLILEVIDADNDGNIQPGEINEYLNMQGELAQNSREMMDVKELEQSSDSMSACDFV